MICLCILKLNLVKYLPSCILWYLLVDQLIISHQQMKIENPTRSEREMSQWQSNSGKIFNNHHIQKSKKK